LIHFYKRCRLRWVIHRRRREWRTKRDSSPVPSLFSTRRPGRWRAALPTLPVIVIREGKWFGQQQQQQGQSSSSNNNNNNSLEKPSRALFVKVRTPARANNGSQTLRRRKTALSSSRVVRESVDPEAGPRTSWNARGALKEQRQIPEGTLGLSAGLEAAREGRLRKRLG